MSMALVMSTMPDVWRKVLLEHVPDQGQRCSACRNAMGESASWPCQTYRVAQEAKWVAEGNLPGTGPHGSVSPRATSEGGGPAPSSSPSWDLDRSPLDRGYAATSYDRGHDPLGGRSLGGPYDPPADSGPVGGLGRGRHAGPSDTGAFGAQMDAPYGASFGVDDRPRGW